MILYSAQPLFSPEQIVGSTKASNYFKTEAKEGHLIKIKKTLSSVYLPEWICNNAGNKSIQKLDSWCFSAWALGLVWRIEGERLPWQSCTEECVIFPCSVQTLLLGLRGRKRFKWGTADLKCSQLQHKELKWHPLSAPLPSHPSALWLCNPETTVFHLLIAHFSSAVCTGMAHRNLQGITMEIIYYRNKSRVRGWKVKDVVLQLELGIPRQQLDFYMGSIRWKLEKSALGEKERSGSHSKRSFRNSGHMSLHTHQTPDQQSIHLQHSLFLSPSQSAPEMLFDNVILTEVLLSPLIILPVQEKSRPGSNLSPAKHWAQISQNYTITYEVLDELSLTWTPPEFWVCVKHLKYC